MDNISGVKRNELTAIKMSARLGTNNENYVWVQCSCGKEKEMRFNNFIRGQVKSCGCKAAQQRKNEDFTYVISNRPAQPPRITSEQKDKYSVRKRIEGLKEKFSLQRECDELSHLADIGV